MSSTLKLPEKVQKLLFERGSKSYLNVPEGNISLGEAEFHAAAGGISPTRSVDFTAQIVKRFVLWRL